VAAAALALSFLLLRYFALQVVDLTDESMRPGLARGDQILVERLSNDFAPGDVVVFTREDRFFVRRVVAVPGQQVALRGGQPWIEGRGPELEKRGQVVYTSEASPGGRPQQRRCDVWLESSGFSSRRICYAPGQGADAQARRVPQGTYLVLCDNRVGCAEGGAGPGWVRKGAVRGRATHVLRRAGEPAPFYGLWEEL
jgi:signal peptidase I